MKRTRLAQRRKAVGLSQEQLAETLGIDRSTVFRWEAGLSEPQPWHRQNLATALRVTVDGLAELLTDHVEAQVEGHGMPFRAVATNLGASYEDADTTAEQELIEFAYVLDQRSIGAGELTRVELACTHIDQQYATLGSHELLPNVRLLMTVTMTHLRKPQPLEHHRRLCALAGRLAGLRAWLCFDLNAHREAERWYGLAVSAAQEAEEWSLAGWLLGAQSLIPALRQDHRHVVRLVERGIYLAENGADFTTRAWLQALYARSQAGLGDRERFEIARKQAELAAERSTPDTRRHGMDFDRGTLDLRYYIGSSQLLLRQPAEAARTLRGSLDALPTTHSKARAVLYLTIADASVHNGQLDEAADLTTRALAAAQHQPILPILHNARRLQRLISSRQPAMAKALNSDLTRFASALTATTIGNQC